MTPRSPDRPGADRRRSAPTAPGRRTPRQAGRRRRPGPPPHRRWAAEGALLVRCRTALGLVRRATPGVAGAKGGAAELAALLGANWRTQQRWEAGETRVPTPVWIAVWFLLRESGRAIPAEADQRRACAACLDAVAALLPPVLFEHLDRGWRSRTRPGWLTAARRADR